MRYPADASGWPMREVSRITLCRPHRWHIQEAGEGPTLLLIHGAGGATQSWRHLFPILAQNYHVIAVDLPGQGFTQSGARARFGLEATAQDLATLIQDQGWQLDAVVGHSAGAAIALEIAATHVPVPVIGINAALGNFKGVAGWLFPLMAKVLAATPLTASMFTATGSSPAQVQRLIDSTGSDLDADGLALYQRLASDKGHVDATLAMMAQWSLDGLTARLREINTPVTLLVGEADKAVPPSTSHDAAKQLANATVVSLGQLGHLAHEEDAALVADQIDAALQANGG